MVNIVGVVFLCVIALISAAQLKEEDVLLELQGIKKLRSLGLEIAGHLQNLNQDDLKVLDSRLSTQDDLLCLSDLAALVAGLQSGQYWALKMFDAWGSVPSGLLTGNTYDLGNFDECLNIKKETSLGRTIQGKYCFLSVSPAKILGVNTTTLRTFKTATCLPATCSAAQMNTFVGQTVKQLLNVSIPSTAMSISDSSCQTSESEPWDGLTIFMIVILSFMGSLVALFTLWDYCLVKNQDQLPAIVKVFSARANSRALFRIVQPNSNPNVIDCLNGIRCLSLVWVVFCHQYVMTLLAANINLFHAYSWEESAYASFILHGFFSVDSFFVLGGLLVALITLRMMDRTKGKLNVPLMYLHRIIRIVPLLAMAIVVSLRLMPMITSGPLFSRGYTQKAMCERSWYWTLLFVNNYTNDRCLGHTWYLSVDMQMFLISPILLIAVYKWGKKAAAGIFVLIVLLSGCLFATMVVNDYSLLMKRYSLKAAKYLYYPTHTHAMPWLVGFLFGYFLHLNRAKKFQLSWLAVWSGWILCLAMIFTSIFALYPAAQWSSPTLPIVSEAFYYTLTRVGFPMAVCWVIFACMQGFGGLANSFLSSPLWQPLSRLSYSVYMWHMFIQEVNARSMRTNSYFSDYRTMLNFWSTFGITVCFAYVMHLLIEAPFGGLGNFLVPKRRNPPLVKQKSQIDENEQKNLEELKVNTPSPPAY
ncbi:nose resistant to fluoxetine protein 6-like [Drosophila subpulchrella]|uniref:nose resistant to fluoxetine protein 6-like n=1 Tax=Drosophila subpulchrella TaxID=1486046 RepID=UPI0018A14573|nr:nose resistant to fluoxetine protein 6-like [Drosophila subpulchrella]XP_037723696.1 nose resistant to fluoxetine protein 6-like [Drosophila subpulchrella]XP_037723702.1 nose resistant to fluoxetine protein 6-like [Drosophila subpulchrella]